MYKCNGISVTHILEADNALKLMVSAQVKGDTMNRVLCEARLGLAGYTLAECNNLHPSDVM